MALVKAKELRELSSDELTQRVSRLRKEYFELLQKKETGQLDRPHRFSHIRREIGQIMTVLGEQSKAGVKSAAAPKAVAPKAAKKAKAPAAKPAVSAAKK